MALLHASCVAVAGRGLLILGPSGAGKSSLAIQMMALGADLVADDQVELTLSGGTLTAACPAPLQGLIEARGVGLLRAPYAGPVAVHLAADLGASECPRLPEMHRLVLLDQPIELVKGPPRPHLAPALLLYLRGGRHA
jgi:HPr kinase/phosphorylase